MVEGEPALAPAAARGASVAATVHRDLGYLVSGHAGVRLSGLAVNHSSDWDPSFTQISRRIASPRRCRGRGGSWEARLNSAQPRSAA